MIIIVAGLLSACTATDTAGSTANDDAALFAELETHTSAWNETLSPVVAHYLDPNVDAETWVAEAGPVFGELEPLIREMGDIAADLSDPNLRDQVFAIIENYQDKLNAFSKLVNAVSAGDTAAEQTAQAELNTATQEGARLAKEMLAPNDK